MSHISNPKETTKTPPETSVDGDSAQPSDQESTTSARQPFVPEVTRDNFGVDDRKVNSPGEPKYTLRANTLHFYCQEGYSFYYCPFSPQNLSHVTGGDWRDRLAKLKTQAKQLE